MTALHVFFDPTGKRRKLLSWIAAILAVFITVVSVLFAITFVVHPFLPATEEDTEFSATVPQHKKELSSYLLKKAKNELDREIAETSAISKRISASKSAPESRIIAAFYSTWQETGVESLRAHAKKVTHLIPEWLHLSESGDELDFADWNHAIVPRNQEVLEIARTNGLKIIPRINNAENSSYDEARVHLLLNSLSHQKKLAHAIKNWLVQQGFQGINIDFQNLRTSDYQALPRFFEILRNELKTENLLLSVTLPAKNPYLPLKRIGELSDFVVMLSFDENTLSSKPGPLSSITWFANALQDMAQRVPPSKIVVAFTNHGIDWPEVPPVEGENVTGESLSYLATLNRARESHAGQPASEIIYLDPVSLTPNFRYVDSEGISRIVWFLDATTSYNQWILSERASVRGAGVWNIGSEDPSLWSFLEPTNQVKASPEHLDQIKFPYQIDFQGRGEILSSRFENTLGDRHFEIDPNNGLIVRVQYKTFPSSVVLERTGYKEKAVALTFDDGPTEEYTEDILDILKKENIKATFFIIGEQAQRFPKIVQRAFAEGHEIGNHTYTHPDMSSVGNERRKLEINVTQRVLQSILGHSTILFRIPYSADAEPKSLEEVRAIQTASDLNYITVGMTVDPQDWRLWNIAADGTRVPRPPETFVDLVIQGLDRGEGSVVLLHDGGGDRTATVKALPTIIHRLKEEGYKFGTISTLLDTTREKLMPPVRSTDLVLVGFNRMFFEVVFALEYILWLAFTIVLIFGVARLLLVTTLAIVDRIRDRYEEYDPNFKPTVSVLVAAYNERKVIVRTIQSILNSSYPNLEVVVVDDGSTDGTSEEVQNYFGNTASVKLITQENTGKAGALNRGIEEAQNEILVCLDADTQLAPDAIGLLVRHFVDPEIGAVAGNVKVGNRVNILTQWQSIEYISSQNLDRRAFSLLNAITVVPGAAGAWRRSAVRAAGYFLRDTLAEDMDLTWRIRRLGWRVSTESGAYGYTEAPDTVRALFKQRFRWSFGSLQCLWKHRSALFHHGWFGWLGLPTFWLFQFGSQVLAPIVDLQLLYALVQFAASFLSQHNFTEDWQPFAQVSDAIIRVGALYVALFLCDLTSSIIAFRMDKEKLKPLFLLFFQRFAYRQLMYAVVWKALWMALTGLRQGWGKLNRTGTVKLPPSGSVTAT